MILIFSAGTVARAQYSSNLNGTITDPNGAAVPNATVVLKSVDSGTVYKGSTTSTGLYHFSNLGPGTYELDVTQSGFASSHLTFHLTDNETQTQDARLRLAGTATTVNVTENPVGINTSETRTQITLSQQELTVLPSQARGVYNLTTLAPGVTGITGDTAASTPPDNFAIGFNTVNISANGRPAGTNNFLLDGISLLSTSTQGAIDLTPNPDAISEVAVETQSYGVDQGSASSIGVNITTRGGSNQFHGDADFTYSGNSLTARQYLQPVGTETPFHRNYFGGSLGGPIRKDRTFIFGGFQIKRSVDGSVQATSYNIPDELVAWAHGAFPASRWASNLLPYKVDPNRFIISNVVTAGDPSLFGSTCNTAATYFIPCDLPVQQNGVSEQTPYFNGEQFNVRLDHYVRPNNDRVTLDFYRFTQQSQYLAVSRPAFGDNFTPSQAYYASGSYNHIFSPNLINDARFGFLRFNENTGVNTPSDTSPNGGLVFLPNYAGVVFNLYFAQNKLFGPQLVKEHQYRGRDLVTWTRGAHNFQFGFEVAKKDYFNDSSGVYDQPFTDANWTDPFRFFQGGSPDFGQVYYGIGGNGQLQPQLYGAQAMYYAFTFHDEYRIKPNLLLTYGLRYDNYGNPSPYGNGALPFVQGFLGTGATSFEDGINNLSTRLVSNGYSGSKNYVQPRLGFNWAPTADRKTTIRGGAGLYLDEISLGTVTVNLPTNSPSRLTVTQGAVGLGPLPSPYGLVADYQTPPYGYQYPTINVKGVDSRGGVIVADPNNPSSTTVLQTDVNALQDGIAFPKTVNFSLGMEQELANNLVAGVTFLGGHSYDQLYEANYNSLPGGLQGTKEFGQIKYTRAGAISNYEALVATIRHRISSLQYQASFTWGHTLDTATGSAPFAGDPGSSNYFESPYDVNGHYSNAAIDVRDRFTFSGVYQVPHYFTSGWMNQVSSGWTVAGVAVAQSGTPFSVYASTPYNGASLSGGVGIPDLGPNAVNYVGKAFSRSQYRTYTPAVLTSDDFAAPATGTNGNAPRDQFFNPGYFSLDLNVGKKIDLPWFGKETSNLTLLADLLNSLNRTNLGPVTNGNDNELGAGLFLKSNTAYRPRTLQLEARFQF
ncbi:MAG TPA: carboxypeptidase-like regulatory domain-containing protein [Acidobacteriaceae bacterium]